jgi:soluble lytic murein transglycosylase-like protein
MSIAEHESGGNQYAENGSCKGLMQVSVRWHADRMEKLGVADIYDEYGNILVATDYISELREDYEEVSYVLDVYNGNSKATYNYENGILSVYAENVLERSAELERLRGK